MMLCVAACFSACSDDDKGPAPTNIDGQTLTYDKRPGGLVIRWTIPENPTYKYIRVTYQVPGESTQRMRLASVYSDSIFIDNLLARYGDIVYQLQPVSSGGAEGNTVSITAQAGEAKKTILETYKDRIDFDIHHVWTDDAETSEGPLSALIDGNENNFFHMSWTAPKPFPHYIVFDLGTPRKALQFRYVCRKGGGRDNPKAIDVLVSDAFTESAATYANKTGTRKLASFTNLPADQHATYETNRTIKSETPFRYVWFKINGSTSNQQWVALAEWQVFKVREKVIDPELNDTTIIEY